jgi:hypothetical protein
MSKKMMIAVMAGTISLLVAGHPASARGGGGHGGLHAMPGAAVGTTSPSGAVARSSTGAAGTSSGNGAQTAPPNTNRVPLGNSVAPPAISSPTAPSNAGASPAGGGASRSAGASSAGEGGTSPSSANGGGPNNLAINPSDRGMSGTSASHPLAGTNTAGTALSSGLPTGESANKAKGRPDEIGVLDREAAKIERIVKSICAGC